jgi:hypothetical protein
MPLSLRIPPDTEKMIKKVVSKTGKTKTGYILEAIHEKLGLIKPREELIREMAGWLSPQEAEELRKSVELFGRVDEADWR